MQIMRRGIPSGEKIGCAPGAALKTRPGASEVKRGRARGTPEPRRKRLLLSREEFCFMEKLFALEEGAERDFANQGADPEVTRLSAVEDRFNFVAV